MPVRRNGILSHSRKPTSASMLTMLRMLRKKSIRAGIWFRALNGLERGLVDLTIRCVDTVKSKSLARALVHVVSKLFSALRSRFLSTVEELGRPLAQKTSDVAVSWGNRDAVKWRFDLSFIRLLGLNDLSNRGWRIVG